MSWFPSWSNSLWQGWSSGLVNCHAGNSTDPIWRVLASSDGISSWTPLKPQHSNPKPNSNLLANQLWFIDFLTPPTPLIIPHRLSAFLESLKPLQNWCSIHASCSKAVWSSPYVSVAFFPCLKQNFIAYRSSKVSSRPDCIFEIHQLWQSGFSRVYSNCCCSCSFQSEIIKIGQSSHKRDWKNILNFQKSTTILNACTKKSGNLLNAPYIYIYIYIYIYMIKHACNFTYVDSFLSCRRGTIGNYRNAEKNKETISNWHHSVLELIEIKRKINSWKPNKVTTQRADVLQNILLLNIKTWNFSV